MPRFAFRYRPWAASLTSVLGMGPARSWIDVGDDVLSVRMGWGFRLDAPRSAVVSAGLVREGKLRKALGGVGVHGGGQRWRVNGAFDPIVRVTFADPQRGRVVGVPVRVSTLDLGADDPEALIRALTTRTG